MIRNQRGSMASAIVLSAIAIGVAATGYFFTNQVLQTTVTSARQAGIGSVTEILMARATQAIAKNVILCSEVYSNQCRVQNNDNAKAEEYGFLNPQQVDDSGRVTPSGKNLQVEAETCLQGKNEIEITDPDAEPEPFVCDEDGLRVTAKIIFSFVNLESLQRRSLVTGTNAEEDLDRFAIKARVIVPVVKAVKEDGEKEFYEVETTAAIRRPRSFLRFEILSRGCQRSCDLGTGLRNNAPCAGPLIPETDSSGGSSNEVTVVNDGPGWVYSVKVFREFQPSPEFADRIDTFTTMVYDSVAAGNNLGIPPGQSITFQDAGIPCFFEFTTVRERGDADGVFTDVTRNPVDSGRTTYAFMDLSTRVAGFRDGVFSCGGILSVPCAYAQDAAENIEPANPLVVGEGGNTIPALRVVTRIVEGEDDEITPDPPVFDSDGGGDGDGN